VQPNQLDPELVRRLRLWSAEQLGVPPEHLGELLERGEWGWYAEDGCAELVWEDRRPPPHSETFRRRLISDGTEVGPLLAAPVHSVWDLVDGLFRF
jgi:hypothetical protein